MNAKDEFKTALREFVGNGHVPVLRWAVVDKVDWVEKTMDVIGVSDDLEYYDVQLGLGGMMVKPAIGSNVLIGVLEGDEAATFLLAAAEIETIELNTSVGIEIDGGENGGLVLSKELVGQLNALEKDINDLKTAIGVWVPVPMDGGAALKTALATWSGKQLIPSKQQDLENKKIKQ